MFNCDTRLHHPPTHHSPSQDALFGGPILTEMERGVWDLNSVLFAYGVSLAAVKKKKKKGHAAPFLGIASCRTNGVCLVCLQMDQLGVGTSCISSTQIHVRWQEPPSSSSTSASSASASSSSAAFLFYFTLSFLLFLSLGIFFSLCSLLLVGFPKGGGLAEVSGGGRKRWLQWRWSWCDWWWWWWRWAVRFGAQPRVPYIAHIHNSDSVRCSPALRSNGRSGSWSEIPYPRQSIPLATINISEMRCHGNIGFSHPPLTYHNPVNNPILVNKAQLMILINQSCTFKEQDATQQTTTTAVVIDGVPETLHFRITYPQ